MAEDPCRLEAGLDAGGMLGRRVAAADPRRIEGAGGGLVGGVLERTTGTIGRRNADDDPVMIDPCNVGGG